MKVDVYERLMRMQSSRRNVLKGAAGAGAALFGSTAVASYMSRAFAAEVMSKAAQEAQANMSADEIALRKAIVKVPGVGKGSPTDADWQKVGEMCLGPTKASVKAGEFKGVELTFMGLNNQNLHDFLFRGFLKPWETYTGAKINWIDLAQADYNPRLQQSIATGTVDFDILEMGAPFEGDVCGKGLTSVMPDWVKQQIDYRRLVDYLKPPVGTWDGKPYRVTIDGDCHNFNYRTDYFRRPGSCQGMEGRGPRRRLGGAHDLAEGPGGHQVPQGQEDRRPGRLRLPRRAQALGRVRLLFPRKPRHRLRQVSRRSGLAVRRRHDEAARQQSGLRARDPGRDRRVCPSEPPNQINADPNETASSSSSAEPGPCSRGGVTSVQNAKTCDSSVVGDVSASRYPAGLGRRLQFQDRQVGEARQRTELRAELRLSRLGRLCDQARRHRLQEAQGGVERSRTSRRQGPVACGR